MKRAATFLLVLFCAAPLFAADYAQPTPGDFIVKDFEFSSGETLPELRIHYHTLGTPQKDAHGGVRNAVLVLHGTTGSGENFLNPNYAGVLFSPDGLHARFPRYGYDDYGHRAVPPSEEGLGVDHLRLLMGTSTGGMHAGFLKETAK